MIATDYWNIACYCRCFSLSLVWLIYLRFHSNRDHNEGTQQNSTPIPLDRRDSTSRNYSCAVNQIPASFCFAYITDRGYANGRLVGSSTSAMSARQDSFLQWTADHTRPPHDRNMPRHPFKGMPPFRQKVQNLIRLESGALPMPIKTDHLAYWLKGYDTEKAKLNPGRGWKGLRKDCTSGFKDIL